MSDEFQEYFKKIRKIFLTRDFTEYTFRTAFQIFIENLNNIFNLHQEQKRTQKLGAPDFKAYKKAVKIGYIETKDLNKNLDKELGSEQIKKYKESINNIILTNYTRFILFRNNQKVFDLNLFSPSDLNNSNFVISKEKIEEFLKMINTFFDYKSATIKSAKGLAEELSKKTKLLKDLAKEQLEDDLSNKTKSSVYDFYDCMKELIKDITIDECSDAYAQTITYGLFLAKIYCLGPLNRNTASSYIPRSIGVIKRIFINIAGDSLPSNLSWIVDDIINILNASDIKGILSEIDFRGKKDRDPFTFFYEDFLSLYDPEKKKHLGVYYTPRPVVSFIVNSVNTILKKKFNKPRGFAEDDVTVLDPAIGTGTFLWLAFILSLVELKRSGLGGLIKKKIENHLLRNFYGFEILITPYIISHLKLTMVLKRWFYKFKDKDRIQVYLTNTLNPSEIHGLISFLREITEESKIANEIKLKKPILVILGNPPYRGMSANKGKWIDDLLKIGYTRIDESKDDGYYKVDGKPLDEKNPKWLQDDYVKFIRFAQWKIDTTGEGIIGFITNHSYLDNPTFRGMRESLLSSFNRIYILNLHGNILKKEKAPDGSKDENVFDIRPGVAITLFVKNKKFKDKKIFYADLFGKREHKYYWLDRNTINTVKWQEIKPKSPYYFLIPKDSSLQEEYLKFWKITNIFPINTVGIVTARDNFVIDFDKETLKKRFEMFRDKRIPGEYFKKTFNLKDKKYWKIKNARIKVMDDNKWEDSIRKINYRPFDIRWIFYNDSVIERSRKQVMSHMSQENLGLITRRQMLPGRPCNYFFVSNSIISDGIIRSDNKGVESLFPLYLYLDPSRKKPNINLTLLKNLHDAYKKKPTPEEIFYYIYAVIHSNAYRTKYADFLRIDFPYVPFTKDYNVFKKLSAIGKELVDLHLMKTKLKSKVRFDIPGSNIIELVKYANNKIYINKKQYFEGISKEEWDFCIGAYRVLDKWLKSRKNRELSSNDIEMFIQIIEIIKQTIKLMKKIDKIKLHRNI